MENPTKQFKVESIESTEKKIAIKGGGFFWSLWKNHECYPIYEEMDDITGKNIEVEYYEKQNPKNAEYPFKNVVKIQFIDIINEQKSSTKQEEKPHINGGIQSNITRGMAFNKAVELFIANKNLDFTNDVWALNLENLVDKLVDVVNGVNKKPQDDDLPF